MKNIKALCGIFALATGPAAFGATAVLSVDFNSDSVTSGTFSNTQAGFHGVNVVNGLGVTSISNSYATSPTLTSGTTTVQIQGTQLRSRERTTTPSNGGALTLSDLYRDFVLSDGTDILTTISGLNAGQTYNVRFYVYDDNIQTMTGISSDQFTNTTTGTQPSPTLLSTSYGNGPQVSADNQFSIALDATADPSGTITFDELNTSPAGSNQFLPILNGLVLTTAPEPASLSVLALGGLLLLRRRK